MSAFTASDMYGSMRRLTQTKPPPWSMSSKMSASLRPTIGARSAASCAASPTWLGSTKSDLVIEETASSLPFASRIAPRGDCATRSSPDCMRTRSDISEPLTICTQP